MGRVSMNRGTPYIYPGSTVAMWWNGEGVSHYEWIENARPFGTRGVISIPSGYVGDTIAPEDIEPGNVFNIGPFRFRSIGWSAPYDWYLARRIDD
jgi:hypothetical protein